MFHLSIFLSLALLIICPTHITHVVASASTTSSTAADAELQQVKYMVGLLKGTGTAVSALFAESSSSPGVRLVSMTSSSGKKFRCSVPDPNFNHTQYQADKQQAEAQAQAHTATQTQTEAAGKTVTDASSASTPPLNPEELAAKQRQAEEAQRKADDAAREKHEQQQTHAIPQRIKTKLSTGCFTKQIDFWTYEICPFKSVRQYHKEGEKVTIEFDLGSYIATGDLLGTAHAPYTQHYGGGANSRQSQVRFLCATDTATDTATSPAAGTTAGISGVGVGAGGAAAVKQPEHMLTHISEPTPHHYEFEIRTVLACKKPYRPVMKAAGTGTGTGAGAAGPAGTLSAHQQVLEILEPLREECLYMNAGWWTYKFCYLKDIAQFHRENVPIHPQGTTPSTGTVAGTGSIGPADTNAGAGAGATVTSPPVVQTRVVTTAENSLGMISPSMTLAGVEDITTLHQGPTWQLSYVAQQYTDGAFCELSTVQKPRTSEVRFYCDPSESVPALRGVEEIRSCEYILTVRTRLLCQHPAFAPSQATVQEIVCQLQE